MSWITWSKFHVYTAISTPYIRLYFIYQIVIMNFDIGWVKVGVLATGKHTTLRTTDKDLLAQNTDDMSEWRDMPTHGLLSQWSITKNIQFSVLVEYKADIIIISLKLTYSRHETADLLAILLLRKITHSNNYNTLFE